MDLRPRPAPRSPSRSTSPRAGRSALLTIASLLALAGGAMGAPPVELRAEARVPGRELRLGDVARVESRGLASLVLGPAPAPGRVQRLERSELALRLRALGARVELRGAAQVDVRAETVRLAGAVLERRARAALDAELRRRGQRADVEPRLTRALPEEVVVAVGRRSSALRAALPPNFAAQLGQGQVTILIEVVLDGDVGQRFSLRYELRRYVEALVLTRDLPSGAPLDPAQLTTRRLERVAGAEPLGLAEAEGQQAARDLPAGTVLRRADLVQPLLVTRGATLELELKTGPLTIVAPARALEDGRRQQPIRVRTLQGRVLRGVVVAKGRVVSQVGGAK